MSDLSRAEAKKLHKHRHKLKYAKWGLIFIIPFFVVYFIFQLYPLFDTLRLSLFDAIKDTRTLKVSEQFVGIQNYVKLFGEDNIQKYLWNTAIIWVLGFVPQMVFSLLFASWFTDLRLRVKATGFFKTVFYLPNMLMAASIAVLFFQLFTVTGPIHQLFEAIGGNPEIDFLLEVWPTRGIIALMNFLMWTGNTTILLMAGIMGIDPELYEAGSIDGAGATQLFWKITMPLLKPIMQYVLITSLIGGLQLFDIPYLLTNGARRGGVEDTSKTIMMYLNDFVNKNYGKAGAIAIVLFVVAALLSIVVFAALGNGKEKRAEKRDKKRQAKGVATL